MENKMNKFLAGLQTESNFTTTENGAKTHRSSLDANLDIFATNLRTLDREQIETMAIKAIDENKETFLKNVLHNLDIRGGKGERRAFKILLDVMISNSLISSEEVKAMIESIVELGRWDYIIDLVMSDNEEVIGFVGTILSKPESLDDLLLWKWMPSTRGARKLVAKRLQLIMGISEQLYRVTLTKERKALKLIETLLTEKRYDDIDFSKVPSKAMIKYRQAFSREANEALDEFLNKVSKGEAKINATSLHLNDLISKINPLNYGGKTTDETELKLIDQMWKNQDNFVPEGTSAIVVADTSASMNGTPMDVSIGLAAYFAERNKGIWENLFITFSTKPLFVKFPTNGRIDEKLKVIPDIISNTDIQKVFELMLKAALTSEEAKESMPEYIIIVSDMEFDHCQRGYEDTTNYEAARALFKVNGLVLPKIIFWNASESRNQKFPVVSNTPDVAMISGFSPSIFENLFSLDELSPTKLMLKTLNKYNEYML